MRHPNQHSHWGPVRPGSAKEFHDKRKADDADSKQRDLERYEEVRKSRPMKPPGKRGQQ